MRRALKIFFTAACLLWLPAGLVMAHATPLTYEPAASSVIGKAPAVVKINFNERIESGASSIIVYAPDGSIVSSSAQPDVSDSRIFTAPIQNAGQGSYTVSWQVVSADDGHFTKGAYVFSLGMTSPEQGEAASFQIQHISRVPEGLAIGAELIGHALLLGLLAVIVFIWRPFRKKILGTEKVFISRINLGLVLSAVLIFAGSIGYLLLKSNELAALREISFTAAFWIFLPTTAAKYTLYRLAAGAVFFLVFLTLRKKLIAAEKFNKSDVVLFLLLGFIAFARAKVSHASASEFHPAFSVVVNFIHLYFKDLWIGGLLALLITFSPIVRKLADDKFAGLVLNAFSKIAAISLGVAGITGVYIIWLHLKGFENILASDWGKKFVILSVFAAALLFGRIINQFFVKKVSSWLPITLAFEAGMGLFVLLVTGNLIITTPPVSTHQSLIKRAASQGTQITLEPHSYESGKFLVAVDDSQVNDLTVVLTNQEQGIGPINAELEKRFEGGYVFDQSQLSPPGKWKIDITAQREGAYDAVASFEVGYPKSFSKGEGKDLGSFEVLSILAVIIILAASVFLYRYQPSHTTSQPAIYERGVWSVPLISGLFTLMLLGGHGSLLQSRFQRLCEKNAGTTFFAWHTSVPTRSGQATSDLAVPGCMVGVGRGQYHFGDEREFLYFTRPAEAKVLMLSEPKNIQAGKPVNLIFNFTDYSNKPVELFLDHDRLAHVIVVSEDFSVFKHIHAEDSGPITEDMLKTGKLSINYTFPKAGKYMVSADFSVRASHFTQQFYVEVSGEPSQASQVQDFTLNKNFEGYDVKLSASLKTVKAGRPLLFKFKIQKDNQAVKNLQPYLAAPMHIAVIRDDLLKFNHAHGLLPQTWFDKALGAPAHGRHLFLPEKFGPEVEASITFPTTGIYHVFGEFKHNGKVVPTHFMLRVE